MSNVVDVIKREENESRRTDRVTAVWRENTGRDASTFRELERRLHLHLGIFFIGVTQLSPGEHVIDLHAREYNEVPVMLGAVFGLDVPIVALHLTRPPIEIPDRDSLRIPADLMSPFLIRSTSPSH